MTDTSTAIPNALFVDTWAWIALAVQRDQHHRAAVDAHRRHRRERRMYVTTDFVVGELITYLYRVVHPDRAASFIEAVLNGADSGVYRLVPLTTERFRRAWVLRRRFHDKPDISFVDFTSMTVMQELNISDVFTGDEHFRQVGLGFTLVP